MPPDEEPDDFATPLPVKLQLALFIAMFLAACIGGIVWARSAEIRGTAERIHDGDTFWVCDSVACTKIRLCGIDAPELGQPGAAEATAALTALLRGRDVRCVQVGGGTPCDRRSRPTNHDRVVAQCFAGGDDVAAVMVRQHHACDWPRFSAGAYAVAGGCSR